MKPLLPAALTAALCGPALAQEAPATGSPADVPSEYERPVGDLSTPPDEIADGVLDRPRIIGEEDVEVPRMLPNLAAENPEATRGATEEWFDAEAYWSGTGAARLDPDAPPFDRMTPHVSDRRTSEPPEAQED